MSSATDLPPDAALLGAALRSAVSAAGGDGRAAVILIDGPSGAGKSSLADAVLARWAQFVPGQAAPPSLVRMDDLYPGWDGLEAGSLALARDLLAPLRATGEGHYRRWDWAAGRPAARGAVGAERGVIVEGCGTLARGSRPYADLTLWLDADDALRKRRAIERDGAAYEREWDRWQRQFDAYVLRERPREAAALRLDVTGWRLDAGARAEAGVLDPWMGD